MAALPALAGALPTALMTLVALGTVAASSAGAYRTGAPAAHTGGFGEPTCETCHFSDGAAPGALTLHAPTEVAPGSAHNVRITLRDPDLRSAGFQLSARFADGPRRGQQAGSLTAPEESGLDVVVADGTEYIGHTGSSVRSVEPGEPVEWTLRWTAPTGGGAVVFHAAANAANDDDSEFGDRIYTAAMRTRVKGDAPASPPPVR
ncbi:MAG TPA: choice-of-anchor V domain-containing protein [Longimicrobiales bacterium]|nr:choice-of-anchor V domain-containing protein [Longimicrobiales bacterium]